MQPQEGLAEPRLGDRAQRLRRLGAHRRIAVGQHVVERRGRLALRRLVAVVRQIGHRRRPHPGVGLAQPGQHQAAGVLAAQAGEHPDRRRPHLGLGVGQAALDQRRGVAAPGGRQDLQRALAHPGVVVVEEQRRHQVAAAVRGEEIQGVPHLARVGAAQRLDQHLERGRLGEVDREAGVDRALAQRGAEGLDVLAPRPHRDHQPHPDQREGQPAALQHGHGAERHRQAG